MARDAYDDAIKAFARLAIASGVEPRVVRDRLGPQALCDTTAARRRPYADLIADVETAITNIGLPLPAAMHCQPTKANTRVIYSDESVRAQFAKSAIDCGAALRKMQESWPQERKRLRIIRNTSNDPEFEKIGPHRLPSAIEEMQMGINQNVAGLRRSRESMGTIEFLKRCRRIIGALDEHDVVVRSEYHIDTEHGSLVCEMSLSQSARIRRWVIATAPGPL